MKYNDRYNNRMMLERNEIIVRFINWLNEFIN